MKEKRERKGTKDRYIYIDMHMYMYTVLCYLYPEARKCTCACNVHCKIYTCVTTHGYSSFCYNSEPPATWTYNLTDVSVAPFREEVGPTMPLPPLTSLLDLLVFHYDTDGNDCQANKHLHSPHPGRESLLEGGHSRGIVGLFFGFVS